VSDAHWARFEARSARFAENCARLRATKVPVPGGARIAAWDALKRPDVSLESLVHGGHLNLALDPVHTWLERGSLETATRFEGYLRQQESELHRARRSERRHIPPAFAYGDVAGLSREVVERLSSICPETIGQAQRIPGITPAAIAVISAALERYAGTVSRSGFQDPNAQ
jgi:tRNA uridine 5-carboxymethylaminomethyl modification enzyme